MLSKGMMGGGALIVGILLALSTYMGWGNTVDYILAALVIIWGLMSFK